MRREDITLTVSHVEWVDSDAGPAQPTLSVEFTGDTDTLVEQLQTEDGTPLDADETDVTFRLHDDPQAPDAAGVVAITNRITGEYVLECNAEATEILAFVRAARRYGKETDEEDLYRVELASETDAVAEYGKRTLLVYGDAGELLRKHSLIPSGVEI